MFLILTTGTNTRLHYQHNNLHQYHQHQYQQYSSTTTVTITEKSFSNEIFNAGKRSFYGHGSVRMTFQSREIFCYLTNLLPVTYVYGFVSSRIKGIDKRMMRESIYAQNEEKYVS